MKDYCDDSIPNIFEMDGHNSRTVQVWIKKDKECLKCKRRVYCVCFDSSDGECSVMSFCSSCLASFVMSKSEKEWDEIKAKDLSK